jgi:RNA recognition motif-containing protein
MSALKKLPVKFNNDGCSLVITNIAPETTEQELSRLADESIACRIFEKEFERVNEDGSKTKVKKCTGFLKFSSNTMALQNLFKLRGQNVRGRKLFVRVKKSAEQIAIDEKHAREHWLEEQRERRRKEREQRKIENAKLMEERAKAIQDAQPVLAQAQVQVRPRERQEAPIGDQD